MDRTRPPARRRVAAALAATALVVGPVVVTSAVPAQAAVTVKACFQRAQTDSPLPNHLVALTTSDYYGWSTGFERWGHTDHTGCATFYRTRTDQRLRVWIWSGGRWTGSAYTARAGYQYAWLGITKAPA